MSLGRFLAIGFLVIGVLAVVFGSGEEDETATDAPAIPSASASPEKTPTPDPPAAEPEPAAPEMMEPKTMSPEPSPQPLPAAAPAPAPEPEEVVFRVTGDPGLPFQGSIATTDTSESVQGVTPQDFPLDVDAGLFTSDIVSANAQNKAGSGYLEVQVVVGDEVRKEASTSAQYGVAQVTWTSGE